MTHESSTVDAIHQEEADLQLGDGYLKWRGIELGGLPDGSYQGMLGDWAIHLVPSGDGYLCEASCGGLTLCTRWYTASRALWHSLWGLRTELEQQHAAALREAAKWQSRIDAINEATDNFKW